MSEEKSMDCFDSAYRTLLIDKNDSTIGKKVVDY